MRIATCNIWNHALAWERRLEGLAAELVALDADVVALQEAPLEAGVGEPLLEHLRRATGYPHVVHRACPPEPDEDERPEGLAVLSRLPIRSVHTNWEGGRATQNSWAMRAVLEWGRLRSGSRARISTTALRAVARRRSCRSSTTRSGESRASTRSSAATSTTIRTRPLGATSKAVPSSRARARPGATSPSWGTRRSPSSPRPRSGSGGATPACTCLRRWVSTPASIASTYLRKGGASDDFTVERAGLLGNEPRTSDGFTPSDHYGVFVDLERVMRSRATG